MADANVPDELMDFDGGEVQGSGFTSFPLSDVVPKGAVLPFP
jgi:hypothetical protein